MAGNLAVIRDPRLVVYTCITGDYDELKPPMQPEPGVDYVCFTDGRPTAVAGWKSHAIPPCPIQEPAAVNRFVKMYPHLLFPDCDCSIYVDGNIQIVGGLRDLAASVLDTADIALYEHPFRSCAYDEARECAAIGHDWSWRIASQMSAYHQSGFPKRNGLFECNVIIRRHTSSAVQALMQAWWEAYRCGIRRDQISLPFVAWRLGVFINNIGKSDQRFRQKHFRIKVAHRRPVPFSTRLRGAINRKFFFGCAGFS